MLGTGVSHYLCILDASVKENAQMMCGVSNTQFKYLIQVNYLMTFSGQYNWCGQVLKLYRTVDPTNESFGQICSHAKLIMVINPLKTLYLQADPEICFLNNLFPFSLFDPKIHNPFPLIKPIQKAKDIPKTRKRKKKTKELFQGIEHCLSI